jgi:hypothetical protein
MLSNSRLKPSESSAFSDPFLQLMPITRNIQFIDRSEFIEINLYAISIETGHERFVIDQGFLVDFVDHRLIRSLSAS